MMQGLYYPLYLFYGIIKTIPVNSVLAPRIPATSYKSVDSIIYKIVTPNDSILYNGVGLNNKKNKGFHKYIVKNDIYCDAWIATPYNFKMTKNEMNKNLKIYFTVYVVNNSGQTKSFQYSYNLKREQEKRIRINWFQV